MSKLQFSVLASGSRGNAVYVQPGDRPGFLLDCGLSKQVLTKRLKMIGKTLDDVDGAFITHLHGDHYYIQCVARLGWRKTYFHHSSPHWFNVHTKITPFRLSHGDCQCYGFRVDYSGMSLAYVVDNNYVPEESLEYLLDLDAIIIEANYRKETLRSRSYSNQYIYGDPAARHLSNDQATCTLSTINSSRLKNVIMAHVSSRNNTPAFARNAGRAGAPQAEILVADQDMPTKMITMMN